MSRSPALAGALAAVVIGLLLPTVAQAKPKPKAASAAYARAVRSVVDSRAGEVADCVDPRTLKPGMTEVRVDAQVTILSDGSVLSTGRSAGKGKADEAVARCMLDKVKAWRFPAPPGGDTVAVEFPITLQFEPPAPKR